jgi:hypothetical protein
MSLKISGVIFLASGTGVAISVPCRIVSLFRAASAAKKSFPKTFFRRKIKRTSMLLQCYGDIML